MSASAQKLFLKPHPVQTSEMSLDSTCESIRRPHPAQRMSPETKPFSGAHSPMNRNPSASLEISISPRSFMQSLFSYASQAYSSQGQYLPVPGTCCFQVVAQPG